MQYHPVSITCKALSRNEIGIMNGLAKRINQFVTVSSSLCVLFYAVSATATVSFKAEQWGVNAWGEPNPKYDSHEVIDRSCEGSTGRANYFELIQRGGGTAELTIPQVLSPGQAYEFSVMLKTANSSGNFNLFFRRDGFPYETSAISTVTVGPVWSEVKLKGIYASSGKGSVRIAARDERNGLCISGAKLMSIPISTVGAPTSNNSIEPRFFGVHLNKLGTHNGWPNFNPGVERLWDSGTTWADLQPVPGPINWERNEHAKRLDYYVSHGRMKNPNVDFILTLAMTPNWAGHTHVKHCNNSSYGESSCTMPASVNDWRNYVHELAIRYRGKIKIWEVWNEADYWGQWDESPRNMVELVRAAYEELKTVDSSNIVIGPNVTLLGLGFLNDFIEAGGAKYIDGVSVHAYVGRSPDVSLNMLRNIRELLKSRSLSLPIWNTETGVSCSPMLEDCRGLTSADHAILSGDIALAQGLLGNAALGVTNFSYYTWEGAAKEEGGLPLVQPGNVTPSTTGLLVERIRSWIDGAIVRYQPSKISNLTLISIERDGEKAFALWSRKGNVTIQAASISGVDRYQSLTDYKEHALLKAKIDVVEEPILLYGQSFKLKMSWQSKLPAVH